VGPVGPARPGSAGRQSGRPGRNPSPGPDGRDSGRVAIPGEGAFGLGGNAGRIETPPGPAGRKFHGWLGWVGLH
jgi:hypothetical protein